MDLDEYALSEAQRTLKRLGITHVWTDATLQAQKDPAPEPVPVAASPSTEGPAPSSSQARPDGPARGRRHPAASGQPSASRPGGTRPVEEPLSPLLRSLFHGKQSPVRTLWTYAGLHADMQQPRLMPRLDMFRKIQGSVVSHLGWTEAEIGTWPLDIPPHLFLLGLRFFRPTIIIGFGPALRFPEFAAGSEGDTILKACTIHALPALEDMAAGDKDLKNHAWKALQQISVR